MYPTALIASNPTRFTAFPRLQDSESVLTVIRSGVEGLRGVMQRIRSEISEPHRQIVTRTRQLEALSETVELLHTVNRVLKLLSASIDGIYICSLCIRSFVQDFMPERRGETSC